MTTIIRAAWAVAIVLMQGVAVPTAAADLEVWTERNAPVAAEARSVAAATRDFAERRALLHMIRAMFDVVPTDSVANLVEADIASLGGEGPTVAQVERLGRELESEAGYLLVSLRYLVEVGGALWPEDRAEDAYAAVARVRLEDLLYELTLTSREGGDLLPVLLALDEIYWWTEGYGEAPSGSAHFAGRDEIVDAALDRHGPTSST